MRDFHREDVACNGYVESEYYANGFGLFLEVGYRKENGAKEDWTLVEIPRKKARRLAKAILKSTKKRSK